MIQIHYTIWSFYKVDISYNIVYKSTMIEYLLVTNILIEVHLII